jgi:hypothetical protein
VDQAKSDCGGKVPVVLHKRNNRKWLLILELDDVPKLAAEIGAKVEELGVRPVATAVSSADIPPQR